MNFSREAARDTLLELRRESSKPKTEDEITVYEERLAGAISTKLYRNPLINNSELRMELREEIGPPTPFLLDGRHVESIGKRKGSRMYRNKLSDLPEPQDCSSSTDQLCELISSPTNSKNTVNKSNPINLLSPSPKKIKSNKF